MKTYLKWVERREDTTRPGKVGNYNAIEDFRVFICEEVDALKEQMAFMAEGADSSK